MPAHTVNLFFVLVIVKNKLTDLCGNRLLQDDFINTFWEVQSRPTFHKEGGVVC